MDTEVDVPNPNFTLVPGMFAEVNFTTDSRSHALTVPLSAVDLAAGNEKSGKVLAVTQDGVVEARDVTLGLETADSFEVLSGLREGDVVIVGNRAALRPGQRVRPKFSDIGAAGAQK